MIYFKVSIDIYSSNDETTIRTKKSHVLRREEYESNLYLN